MSASGFRQSRGHDRLQSQTHARRLTQELRRRREKEDFLDDLDDDESEDEEPEVAAEDAESADFLPPDDSVRPVDFSWQDSEGRLNDYFLARLPRARWRVALADADAVQAVRVGTHCGEQSSGGPTPDDYRRAILQVAATEQLPYLQSGNPVDLRVLTRAQLVAAGLATGMDQAVWNDLARGSSAKDSLGRWTRGQYFYDRSGRLHALKFLLQPDLWGAPEALVFSVIGEVARDEVTRNRFLSNRDMASALNLRIPGLAASERTIRRLRQRATVWLPKRSDRRKLYGRS